MDGNVIASLITAIFSVLAWIFQRWYSKREVRKKNKIKWLNHDVVSFLKENTEAIKIYDDLNIKDEGKRKLIKDLGAYFLASTEKNIMPFIVRLDTEEITIEHAAEYRTQQALWTGTLIDFFDTFKNRCRICRIPEETTDKILFAFSSKTEVAVRFLSDTLRFTCNNDLLSYEAKIDECLKLWLGFLQSLKDNLFETANGINGSLYGIIYDGTKILEGKTPEHEKIEELEKLDELKDKLREADNMNIANLRDTVETLNQRIDCLKKEVEFNSIDGWKDDQE